MTTDPDAGDRGYESWKDSIISRVHELTADAEAIARIAEDRGRVIAAIRDLHESDVCPDQRRINWVAVCLACGEPWPCPTTEIIEHTG